MIEKNEQMKFFSTPTSSKQDRQRYLKFEDVKYSVMPCVAGGSKCFDCESPFVFGEVIVHIYEYELSKFSAFLCQKCFEVFKTNEVEL